MIDRRSQFTGRRIKNVYQWKIGVESLKYSFKKRNIVLTSKEDKSNWSPPSVPERRRKWLSAKCQLQTD